MREGHNPSKGGFRNRSREVPLVVDPRDRVTLADRNFRRVEDELAGVRAQLHSRARKCRRGSDRGRESRSSGDLEWRPTKIVRRWSTGPWHGLENT